MKCSRCFQYNGNKSRGIGGWVHFSVWMFMCVWVRARLYVMKWSLCILTTFVSFSHWSLCWAEILSVVAIRCSILFQQLRKLFENRSHMSSTKQHNSNYFESKQKPTHTYTHTYNKLKVHITILYCRYNQHKKKTRIGESTTTFKIRT